MAALSEPVMREALQVVTAKATADSVAVLRLAGSVDDVLAAVPGILEVYSEAAASLAADHYDDLRETAGAASAYRTAVVVDFREEQIRRGLLWSTRPLIESADGLAVVESRLASVVTLETARPYRDTMLTNTRADPSAVGWTRHVNLDGCRFCRMLAGRGAVYRAESARFASHPHCSCTAAPVFRGEAIGAEASVLQYVASQRRRTPEQRETLRRFLAAMPD